MVEPYLLHFVVRNVTYTPTLTGYLVTCYTNYPVHLFKRETTTQPQKHINPVVVRGAPVGTYIDQCFVVYTDIDQQEPGDTYEHTFIEEPWPYCETRWFYFWGTVEGQLSPSASAIFSFHSKLAVYCYQEPKVPENASSWLPNYKLSYAFRPCSTFTITHITLWVRKSIYYPQPPAIHWQLYLPATLGMPVIPIGKENTLNLPTLTTDWLEFRAPLDTTWVLMSKLYAFAVWHPFTVPPVYNQRIYYRAGMNDSCPAPLPQLNRSYLNNGAGWVLYGWDGFNYKLEGEPYTPPP